jgi:hypothetical protein
VDLNFHYLAFKKRMASGDLVVQQQRANRLGWVDHKAETMRAMASSKVERPCRYGCQ